MDKKQMDIIKQYMSELGKKGGSIKSEAKKKASSQNGKLGGRPRKQSK